MTHDIGTRLNDQIRAAFADYDLALQGQEPVHVDLLFARRAAELEAQDAPAARCYERIRRLRAAGASWSTVSSALNRERVLRLQRIWDFGRRRWVEHVDTTLWTWNAAKGFYEVEARRGRK